MSSWSNEDFIRFVYRGLLSREPDPAGLTHFVEALSEGEDLRKIINNIVESGEYQSKVKADLRDPLDIGSRVKRPITIVDVGARALESEDHIYAPLINGKLDWRCIGFEPQMHRLQERAHAESNPNLTLIDAFIGDGSEAVFHVVNDDGSSSLLDLNLSFNAPFDDISKMRVVSKESVKTVTLDDALHKEEYIDFLKLDIQGFEWRALRGAEGVLKRTNVVHCEVLFGPQYIESNYFRDIDTLLSDAGFEFVDFSHLNRYHYVKVPFQTEARERLIWADAVFFKKDPVTEDDQIAQAAIASMIYKKHGLAQTVLGMAIDEPL